MPRSSSTPYGFREERPEWDWSAEPGQEITRRKVTSAVSVTKICCVLLWTLLSLAMIIIGSMHVEDCPVEPKIPIYLIVAGVSFLVAFALIPLKLVAAKVTYTIETILGLFSFCWFIAGSVWVFRIYQDNPRDCNDFTYMFAFRALIFEYIFLAFLAAVICICTCCVGVKMASGDTETPDEVRYPAYEVALT